MKAVDRSRVENHVEGQQKQLMDTKASAQHRRRNSKGCVCTCVLSYLVCRCFPPQTVGVWTDPTLEADELNLCRLT